MKKYNKEELIEFLKAEENWSFLMDNLPLKFKELVSEDMYYRYVVNTTYRLLDYLKDEDVPPYYFDEEEILEIATETKNRMDRLDSRNLSVLEQVILEEIEEAWEAKMNEAV